MTVSRLLLLSGMVLLGCSSGTEHPKKINHSITPSPVNIQLIGGDGERERGEVLEVLTEALNESLNLTHAILFLNETEACRSDILPFQCQLSTGELPMGKNIIRVSYQNGQNIQSKSISFTLRSNREPQKFRYEVVGDYPHDPEAYTQGLFVHKGNLYESTGHKGLSSIRKVDISGGKVLQKSELDDEIFGEGIALFGRYIYQLSWQNQVGFVYREDDLKEVRRFYYSGEGWGLTSDSTSLIRSDGSNRIFFHHPDDFRELRVIEVYDNKGPVSKLNELEYIGDRIYANVYQQDEIAIIDPESGEMVGRVDMSGLLPSKYKSPQTDVLNGIAFDPVQGKIFVTGKFWPKLFEVTFKPVAQPAS